MELGDILESKINRSDYKILIVDDVTSNVLLLKILLTNEKFQICTASNGHQCVEVARSEHPDLILLDVMMPELNGFDTAVILKKDPLTADIPIIFLTALNSPSDLVHGFQVGAHDFLTKPFNKEELIMRVMHQISLVAAKRYIIEQNEKLKRIISNRDKMYSVIAHDLRSPMASIRMVLNLCVNVVTPDMVGEEIFGLLDKANRESEETHDLLDNLLKWTKSQTGRLEVAYQNLELDDIVPGVVDIFTMIAEMKKIKLQYIPSEEHLKVRADNDMMKTVVRNFISNAIKFTPEGKGIEVYYKKSGEFAKISVRDHGVGIAPERIDTLFHKGETTYGTGGEEGSGLGLQLCADFARKNGGDVMVESTLGEGSTFSFLVPLLKEEA
ncbi:hybrid sensor histidine kinase/response regulator [Prevotella sp. P3-120]|uniref:histidine kinase n=1 Tax=Xylanibacter brevis TaxID=83231 RepID=A0ABS9CL31_9BACT|nr:MULTISPECIES: hybrid sensor histidine kinase/response regulator [Prevotellaceae]MBS7319719.1 hybrid sensor histidine kinase/response regulator [Prevotella sp.]MCF2558784.1 hybrid sensor histidine kinase/response regulator [Xylanibacter brevis]MCF2564621.1 hybrid sensor histidine kinase/response regulator [Xylanibacter brevis]MCI7002395.1 hybrid sensor histidine kinase/response regulator [Prevotella sp.]OYP39415.1 hybrid sensor histidine kinase/response regulator [Prevotella sp. P5-126]